MSTGGLLKNLIKKLPLNPTIMIITIRYDERYQKSEIGSHVVRMSFYFLGSGYLFFCWQALPLMIIHNCDLCTSQVELNGFIDHSKNSRTFQLIRSDIVEDLMGNGTDQSLACLI